MPLRLSTTLNGEVRHWVLERSPVSLGRASGNTIQLLDSTVSKAHAELAQAGERWTIRDLGSRNGTRVNGRDALSPLPIASGDRVEVGHVLLSVSETQRDEATRFSTSEHVGSSLKLKVSDVLQRSTAGSSDGARVLHVLAEAGQLLVVPRPLDETCQAILGLVESALPTSRLVILLRGATGPASGDPADLRQAAARYRGGRADEPLALSQTILKTVLAENTAVITGDAANDPRFHSQHSIIAHAVHSAMAVPLFDNERVLGILYADSSDPLVNYGQRELELLTLLGNMAAVKITNVRLNEAEQVRRRLEHELATATRIQQSMLSEPPTLPGWLCHARIESCYEVGGDLYDVHVRGDGTIVLLVGDVTGKGIGAAMLMSSTLSSARVLYDECRGPLSFMKRLNPIVFRNSDGRSHVTMFVGWLDPASGALRYVNGGHPPPHLLRRGELRTLDSTGIAVGALEDFPWTEGEVVLSDGETLAVFSDGIPEAQRGDEFFDYARTAEALREAEAESDLSAMADRVISKIDAFAAGEHRADDVTLLLLRRA
jgi:sigma-B regulation protein RsbU (phosphoserine phosphatase)